jgi:hypothetical protein
MFQQSFAFYNQKSGPGVIVNSETTLNWADTNATGFVNLLANGIPRKATK